MTETADPSPDPRRTYEQRLAERRQAVDEHDRRERLIAHARLVVFAGAIVLAWLAFVSHRLVPEWLFVPGALFLALVIWHSRIITRRRQVMRAVAFYERGLQRLDDAWMGRGTSGEDLRPVDHPYANDLDLFGVGSLFELLCTARTSAGERTLADWLCQGAAPHDVRDRQTAVIDLRDRLDLREDLAVLGEEVRTGVRADGLVEWAAAPIALSSRVEWGVAAALSVIVVLAFVGWGFLHAGFVPALISVVLVAIFLRRVGERVKHVVAAAERPGRDLALLSDVLDRFDHEQVTAPRLLRLKDNLSQDGVSPTQAIRRLVRLLELLDSARNPFFAPAAFLVLWQPHLAFAVERWRARWGRRVPVWLSEVGELEALSSFANHAFEHPHDPMPELVDDGPLFQATALAHPLLSQSACVRNDLELGNGRHLLVVSGSNMSGKSTLLRTVGINAVLALAGAPVRAESLKLSTLSIGASLRTMDSLQDGRSRFYAEITRLRQIMDLTDLGRPVLFLIDEILQGTNSHDRRIGAEAVLREFVDRGAIGLATTHDLVLTRVGDMLEPKAANVHFEDYLEDGRLAFDYRLRGGVVTHSNAIALMRAVGLKV